MAFQNNKTIQKAPTGKNNISKLINIFKNKQVKEKNMNFENILN